VVVTVTVVKPVDQIVIFLPCLELDSPSTGISGRSLPSTLPSSAVSVSLPSLKTIFLGKKMDLLFLLPVQALSEVDQQVDRASLVDVATDVMVVEEKKASSLASRSARLDWPSSAFSKAPHAAPRSRRTGSELRIQVIFLSFAP